MKHVLFTVLVFFLLCVSQAHALTYYVAKTGSSDSNDCTQAQSQSTPKLTITSAMNCRGTASGAGAGHTVIVKAGTYAEALLDNVPGGTSWASPFTLRAFGTDVVILQATGALGMTFQRAAAQYTIVDGIIFDGTNLTSDIIHVCCDAHHIRIMNGEVRNGTGAAISMTPGNSTAGNFNEFINLKVHDNFEPPGAEHGFYIKTDSNLVERCEIYANNGYGIHMYGNGVRVVHNNIIRSNIIHDNQLDNNVSGAGILLGGGTGNAAYNNIVYGNDGGIRIAYDVPRDTLVYNNTIYNNVGVQGAYCIDNQGTDSIIRNNICWQHSQNILNPSVNTSHNLTTTPSFVNAAGGDFRLQTGSAAINTGTSTAPTVTTDIDGTARPQGAAYDIGAYESAVAVAPVAYYVAKTGHDTNNDCTEARSVGTPKLTIAAGIACMASGDTLNIGDGVYTESILNNVPSGSSWSAPTTIKATNSLQVTLRPTGAVRVLNFDNGSSGGTTNFSPSYLIIDGLVIDGANASAAGVVIEEGAHHIRLQNCEVKNAFLDGIDLWSGSTPGDTHTNEILNCSVHDNVRTTTTPENYYGIDISSPNNLIQASRIYNHKGIGIQVYSATGGTTALAGNRILGNEIYASAQVIAGYSTLYIGGTATTVIANNIIRNNGGRGLSLSGFAGSPGCDACKVYSNTIYSNAGEGIRVLADTDVAVIRNNILYNNTSSYSDAGIGTVLSNNLLATDPLFVNAAGLDFHLQSGSPARDTGFTLGSPYNVDFDGSARPSGSAYDIGAYEFIPGSVPNAPTLPTATPGDTQVTVGWTDSVGATSYTVLRSTVSGGSYSQVASLISASPYINTGLTNGTTYYYVVTAVNANGSSAHSTQTSATPQPPAPSAPTGLIATGGDTQVSLTWLPTAGAVTYNVLRSTTSGSGYASIVTGITSPSYLNTGLTNTTTYYYVVQAVNGGGTSPNSAQAGATPATPPPAIPAPPTNFMAVAGDTQVSLSWTASSTALTYTVKRGTVSGGPYGTTVISALATTSHVDTGRTNGTTYYYVVTAVNAGGESGNSVQASATPQIPVPAAPTAIISSAGDTQVTLSWTAAAGATSYSVYKATITGGPYGAAVATGITATTYDVLGLTNTTPYFFVVTTVNAGGESAFSTETSATPQPMVPAAPTGLGVTASSQQVTLTWSAVAGAASYTVTRASSSGGGAGLIASGITTLTYTDTAALNGVPYYYLVTATNINGTSLASAEISATPRVVATMHVIGTTATKGRVVTH